MNETNDLKAHINYIALEMRCTWWDIVIENLDLFVDERLQLDGKAGVNRGGAYRPSRRLRCRDDSNRRFRLIRSTTRFQKVGA
jgi:hypothetical protein